MSAPRSSPLRSFRLSLIAACLAILAACGGIEPDAAAELPDDVGPVAADADVTVGDNFYEPEELVVEVGTEVTWIWEGRAAHDVVGDGFESEILAEGEFRHTFDSPGSYHYVCTLHPGMEATVYVVPTEDGS